MIVLDTCVLSEPLRPEPNPMVVRWLDVEDIEQMGITTITLAEMRAGLALMPAGRRRERLTTALETNLFPIFTGRVFGVDEAASKAFATVIASARAAGHVLQPMDALIASICLAHGHQLATRNLRDFAAVEGLELVSPWEL